MQIPIATFAVCARRSPLLAVGAALALSAACASGPQPKPATRPCPAVPIEGQEVESEVPREVDSSVLTLQVRPGDKRPASARVVVQEEKRNELGSRADQSPEALCDPGTGDEE